MDRGGSLSDVNRVIRARLLIAGLACLACAGERNAVPNSTVTVAYCCGAEVLSPASDVEAKMLIFQPLVSGPEKSEMEGRLARSWERSADDRVWIFHLRSDVNWHDGVPVTGHDIKFTLELLMHPAVNYFPRSRVDSIAVPDDSTVVIYYANPTDGLDWWTVYYPRHLLEELDPKQFWSWPFWTSPVGNGPYRFVRYVPETMMEFEANPNYYRDRPKIRRVLLKFTRDAAVSELLSGTVDAATHVSPADAPKLLGDARFRAYYSMAGQIMRVAYWRHGHPLFGDRNVRRALTLAINREELRTVLNLPDNIPVLDGIPTARQIATKDLLPPLAYDSATAARLLDEAGWRDSDGDGVRDKNGTAFRFTALIHPAPGFDRMAVYIQASLRRVGIAMNIQPMDGTALRDRLRSGKYDAALTRSALPVIWLPVVFGPKGHLGYRNPELLALIDRLSRTADPGERDAIHTAMTRMFQADAPVTFLLPEVWTAFAHRRVRGLSTPWRADPVMFMEELSVEGENR